MGVDLLAMKKILVVDDNTINLKLADKILKENPDYKPVMVPSGARALQFLSKNVPDMILLDIMMPGVDGFAFLSSVREDKSLDHVRVVLVSAVSESEEVHRALSMGANDYLTKPINAKRLYSCVAQQIQQILGGD